MGGLSIFETIRRLLPSLSIVYGCDNRNFPYGPKTPDQVTQCIESLAIKTQTRFNPSLLVVACNTASTVALESLRGKLPIPVVGVVPAIKPAALKTKTRVIGLLATPGTVERSYTHQLIKDHATHCEVIKVGSTKLVEMAEDKLRGNEIAIEEIQSEIAPLFSEGTLSKIDVIILGCTHFPLLLPELIKAAPKKVDWIDSSEAVASRVSQLVGEPSNSKPTFRAVFTELNSKAKELEPYLKSLHFTEISEVS